MLGRALSGFLAVFWGLRLLVQLFYYDPNLRRANRLADMVFILCFVYLASIFSIATLGMVK